MLDRLSTSSGTAQSTTCSQTSSRPSTIAYEKPTDDEVHQKPWKYIGYKGYSDFISSEDDFFLLRRFDELNVRVALAMQDEITQLEEELEDVDKGTMAANAPDFNNSTLRGDIEGRSTLIKEISQKLRHYNELILQQPALRRFPKAAKRHRKNLQNWHFNHDFAAIAREEQAYLAKEDLISVAYTEKTPLRQVIDSSLRLRTLSIWRHRENEAPSYDAREVSYYSDERMNAFVSAVIIAIGVFMLLTPIWVLQAIEDLKGKLAVITIFVFIFLLVLSLGMVAKPFEVLGATAASDTQQF
ncbi:hypothetical protein CGCS363_v002119 [Colletotrichum siamense]|uniref:uncharacterized protein n=1 Tax=Colletotrichum siamense TaxID=690259 RepID=UPI001872A508|nr:uncharacterized protein CGCS363_v002119 [Colletotrichum siamense]KAF5511444.1 hypothetical protein CGCS363_v002119 [Colletotrichum siamense]